MRTQIVGVEGNHADHLTTTTAQYRQYFWAFCKNITFWLNYTVATFWANFGKIWATFYSNIWSHWTYIMQDQQCVIRDMSVNMEHASSILSYKMCNWLSWPTEFLGPSTKVAFTLDHFIQKASLFDNILLNILLPLNTTLYCVKWTSFTTS